jgi:hypothetical protein
MFFFWGYDTFGWHAQILEQLIWVDVARFGMNESFNTDWVAVHIEEMDSTIVILQQSSQITTTTRGACFDRCKGDEAGSFK